MRKLTLIGLLIAAGIAAIVKLLADHINKELVRDH